MSPCIFNNLQLRVIFTIELGMRSRSWFVRSRAPPREIKRRAASAPHGAGGARGLTARGKAPDLFPPETVLDVIVHHADRLHERVHNRGPHERESTPAKILAECV